MIRMTLKILIKGLAYSNKLTKIDTLHQLNLLKMLVITKMCSLKELHLITISKIVRKLMAITAHKMKMIINRLCRVRYSSNHNSLENWEDSRLKIGEN